MTKQNRTPKVRYFLVEFVEALREQLVDDDKRWGTTWLERTRAGQEERVFDRFYDYYNDFKTNGTPIPWLKVVGNAMIAWIREQHPELSPAFRFSALPSIAVPDPVTEDYEEQVSNE